MRPNKQYILVKIDKKKRDAKREKIGNIYLPPAFLYMAYNLQYGEILGIGSLAQKDFPQAEIGDTAIFHHNVEGDREDSNLAHLIETDADGNEHRLVQIDENYRKTYEMFAIIKKDGTLIPSPYHMFLENKTEKMEKKIISALIEIDNDYNLPEDIIRQKIEQHEVHARSINESIPYITDRHELESTLAGLAEINAYRTKLTKILNKLSFVTAKVLHIAPSLTEHTQVVPGDSVVVIGKTLYPLEIMGTHYLIADTDLVYARVNTEENKEAA